MRKLNSKRYEEQEINWDKDIDWEKVPVGTKVFVSEPDAKKNSCVEWFCDYLVFYNKDKEYKYCTMMPINGPVTIFVAWKYCKLANKEDIEKYKKR